jgi:putative transposase
MFSKFKQKNLCEASIRKVCKNHNIKVHTLYVNPEHVHMLVTLPHTITGSQALQLLKGGSAYIFFRNHSKSRIRLPKGHLWSAGGCAITVGYNEFGTVDNCIRNQATHHA